VIAVTGGTGTLGRRLVDRLIDAGQPVRLLVRDGSVVATETESVVIDLADEGSLVSALSGVDAVVSAMTGFNGARGTTPRAVDAEGNRNLAKAAHRAGVQRFVLVSIRGAAADHPIDVHRMKHLAEEALSHSDLDWTIVRPTVYMETWGELLGAPVLAGRPTRVFGAGDNPVNFISADDVARIITGILDDQASFRQAIDVAGPDNPSMMQVVTTFEQLSGKPARVQHVPVGLLRVAAVLLRPVNQTGARFAQGGLQRAVRPMAADASPTRERFPAIDLTAFADYARQRVEAAAAAVAA